VAERLFPVILLDADGARDLGHGKRIPVDAPDASTVAAIDENGRLVALVEVGAGRARVLSAFPLPALPARPEEARS
jgi:tRNA pseudouridine55 synthase